MCNQIQLYFVFFQAIFMIPTNPPPTFRKPELWSDEFTDFVKKCLVKNPEQRATATQLLQVGEGKRLVFLTGFTFDAKCVSTLLL